MSTRMSQICLVIGTVVWPLLLYLFLSYNPGTVPPPRMPSSRDRPAPERTAPPTDQHGSRVILSETASGQRASIFWEIPEPGRVHVTIELPPPESQSPSNVIAP